MFGNDSLLYAFIVKNINFKLVLYLLCSKLHTFLTESKIREAKEHICF